MRAYGLQTHIWNNAFKSLLLLAGFPVLLLLMTYGVMLLWSGMTMAADASLADPFADAARAMTTAWPFAFIAAGVWFAIAFVSHGAVIDAATGARSVTRQEEPALHNLLENLCISRGIPMPKLKIIETQALNAYASGLTQSTYAVTVTRGLMHTLNEAELEAVLAHELTHIRNQDVRLLVIAVVFVGIFSFIGEGLARSLRHVRISGGSSRSSSRDDAGAAALAAILAAFVIIAVSYGLAVVIRFALSRRREYLADAGAVDLTKDPDAMISALRKIGGADQALEAPAELREMFFDNPRHAFGDLFATHPPIAKRIEALVRYAAGRDWTAERGQISGGPVGQTSPWRAPDAKPPPRGPWS
jgi:heat shock protein HtpX